MNCRTVLVCLALVTQSVLLAGPTLAQTHAAQCPSPAAARTLPLNAIQQFTPNASEAIFSINLDGGKGVVFDVVPVTSGTQAGLALDAAAAATDAAGEAAMAASDRTIALMICDRSRTQLFPQGGSIAEAMGLSSGGGEQTFEGWRFPFRPESTGRYVFAVRNLVEGAQYEIFARSRDNDVASAGATFVERPLAFENGKTSAGAEFDVGGNTYIISKFVAPGDQVARVTLTSEEGDPRLTVLSSNNLEAGPWEVVGENDDTGETLNSLLSFRTVKGRAYAIVTDSLFGDAVITLGVTLADLEPFTPAVLARNAPTEFAPTAEQRDSGMDIVRYYRVLAADAGERQLTVTANVPVSVEIGTDNPVKSVDGRAPLVPFQPVDSIEPSGELGPISGRIEFGGGDILIKVTIPADATPPEDGQPISVRTTLGDVVPAR